MTSLNNIEELLEIDLTNKQLRDGKKRHDKNKYYWYSKQYYIVQLSADKWTIMSSNQTTRDLLSDNIWRNANGYAITNVLNEDGINTTQKFHWLAIEYDDDMVVDHINRLTYDNRTDNLRETTVAENMKNRTKNTNNTSGKNGISKDKVGKNSYWTASISDNNGNRIRKSFSIEKLGNRQAKRQAIAFRLQKEQLYNYTGE